MKRGAVKQLREGLGLTRAQLAQLLAVHPNTVARWEDPSTAGARLEDSLAVDVLFAIHLAGQLEELGQQLLEDLSCRTRLYALRRILERCRDQSDERLPTH